MEKLDKQSATDEQKTRDSRRSFLRNTTLGAVGSAGLVAAGAALITSHNSDAAHASSASGKVTSISDILTIGRTAERLAVTFYTQGLAHADYLGLYGADLLAIGAALVEEQIHENYFAKAGGKVLTSTFSFPHGGETFTNLNLFIETQQQLEGVFDSAFLSAIREFAAQGRPDLAQLAGQIAAVEADHRALGRYIGRMAPADNWAFYPVLVAKVGDAPALVKKAGYLSPRKGNSYAYKQVSTKATGITYTTPYVAK